jgi:phosphate transport system permease protein
MSNINSNSIKNNIFKYLGLGLTCFALLVLAIFIFDIAKDGISFISVKFLTNAPSTLSNEKAGIYPALGGSLWIFFITAFFAIPIGVAAGIYLEEYLKKGRFSSFLELNLSNLAGVPSVIYGLLGLALFKGLLHFKHSNVVIAGAFTLALLILPIIIVATREAIRAVPKSLREASFGLGATKWQTIWYMILPSSIGGIITGTILALSRAMGETAPLLILGTVLYIKKIPKGLMDKFTVLPMQIYNWVGYKEEYMVNASAAIIVLLVVTFLLNGFAIYLRNKWQKKVKW